MTRRLFSFKILGDKCPPRKSKNSLWVYIIPSPQNFLHFQEIVSENRILTPATVQPDKDFQAGLWTDREPQSPGLHTKAVSWPLVKSFLSAEPFFPRTVLSLLGLWGEEDFRWARGLSHEGQWRKQLPVNQVVTTSKESLLECSECLWSKPRAFTLCSSSPEIPACFPLHSRNVQGCSSNS